MKTIDVISLGWGVQSFALAAMSATGFLPRVDAIIHADTGHEKSETYAFAKKWKPWLESKGMRVITVEADPVSGVAVPAYVNNNGKIGMLKRHCTVGWKISPIRRQIRWEVELNGCLFKTGTVRLWLGITTDEFHRAKDSRVKYITHEYPFLDMGMSREDVKRWLKDNGFDIPVSSSCVFCPYHSRSEWESLSPDDLAEAIRYDNSIRHHFPDISEPVLQKVPVLLF